MLHPKSAAGIKVTGMAFAAVVMSLFALVVTCRAGDTHSAARFGKLCGDYQFDLTDAGAGTLIVKFLRERRVGLVPDCICRRTTATRSGGRS